MSNHLMTFKVGEKVNFPQLVCNQEGKHELVSLVWQIKAIFPVSQLVLLTQGNCKKASSVQTSLSQLASYN